MALRSQILTSSLPLLPTHSFTRPTLIQALRTIKPELPNPESVVDTLFGPGSVGASKALVERWEEEGLKAMSGPGEGKKENLGEVLRRRIEYSARAYANLSTPSSTPSIPLPSLPILRALLSSIKLPPSYIPPSSPLHPAPTSNQSASSILDQISNMTGHRLPLLSIDPLGPMGYAWRIADEALYLSETRGKKPGAVRRGYWNEPTGPGPEWYTKRIGLSLVYLSSESPLLQPNSSSPINTHLPQALKSLEGNLNRYHSIISSLENTESNLGDTAGFVDFVARSIGGIARSRYM
uniref:COQ9 C-terminal domain-containing protein n=1 Tax=Kwoniella bestiolae CBS 10118 TaxID=1296100 RepID=A0A1B9G8N4_9TREE|nr:hypothetical protein I302_02224 [Kwoniella bestiolae CBS 10118]OCF27382.1 hypothetical protein I302_02224 [Kwoniella bestiolae CBS 10118]